MKLLSHQISFAHGCKWQLWVDVHRNNRRILRCDGAAGLALLAGAVLGGLCLASAASLAAAKCPVEISVDRVYRSAATRAPAALVTLRHDCHLTAEWFSLACTWLQDGKPVAVAETLYQNVPPNEPATRKLLALDADGVAFDAARCRLTGSRP